MGDDVANPTSRILTVAVSSGNEVDVAVEYGLSCYLTDVDPDIESFYRRVLAEQEVLDLAQELVACLLFPIRKQEIGTFVSFGDDEGMSLCDGEVVFDRYGVLVFQENPLGINVAKYTRFHS